MYSFFMYFGFCFSLFLFRYVLFGWSEISAPTNVNYPQWMLIFISIFFVPFSYDCQVHAMKQRTSYYYYVYGGGYIVYYTGWTAKRQWCSPFYGFRFLFGILALSSQTHSCPYANRLALVFLSFSFALALSYLLLSIQILLSFSLSLAKISFFCHTAYTQKHGHDAKLVFTRASNDVFALWWQNENKPTQSY